MRVRLGAVAGALLGTFVGDAIGAPYEGARPVGPGAAEDRLRRSLARDELTYTDDTQLALALAEHLVRHPLVDPRGLVDDVLAVYEPWRGYGSGMRRTVRAWRAGADLADAATVAFPDGSFGNGAAMRVAPVGVRWAHDRDVLRDVATRSAAITHTHPVGIDGAVAVASAVAAAATSGAFTPDHLEAVAGEADTPELRAPLHDAVRLAVPGCDPRDAAERLGNVVVAHLSVPVALWVAATARDVEDAVLRALAVGGDTDTIAAMACAVRGAADGADAIPVRWRERLEDGPRGRGYAVDLAARLHAAVP